MKRERRVADGAEPRHKGRMTLPLSQAAESPIDAARGILRRTFGHADFRGLQAEVIG